MTDNIFFNETDGKQVPIYHLKAADSLTVRKIDNKEKIEKEIYVLSKKMAFIKSKPDKVQRIILLPLYSTYTLYNIVKLLKNSISNTCKEYRKVQGLVGDASLSIVLPKSFANALGIGKGDVVKVYTAEEKIIVEKAQ